MNAVHVFLHVFYAVVAWLTTVIYTECAPSPKPLRDTFSPPPRQILDALTYICTWLFPPSIILNSRDLPRRKCLIVAPHGMTGIDSIAIIASIYRATGVLPRGLGESCHFWWPGYPVILRALGVVSASRENVRMLMHANQVILVFPGGADEVCRKKNHGKYTLIWRQRCGFAKLALEFGYPLVPIAHCGFNDMLFPPIFSIPLKPISQFLGDRYARFSIPICLPRSWEKMYISILPAVIPPKMDSIATSTEEFNSTAWELREVVKASIEREIDRLIKQVQAVDPDRYLLHRSLRRLGYVWNYFGIWNSLPSPQASITQ